MIDDLISHEDVDFSEVHADDRLLDSLGAGKPQDQTTDELSTMLLAWRQSIDADPIHELVSLPLAVVTVVSAVLRRRGECA